MDKVQVSFYSRQAEYAVQDTPILIPTRLKRSGLSEIINHLLDIQDQIPFDFIIDGKFLRQSLQSYLDSHGLSSENVLKIEFVRVSLPPQESATLNHDDWISSVKINTVIATGSFDGKLRIWDNQANVVDSMGGQDPLKCIEFLSNNLIVTGDIKNNVVGYSFSGQVLEKKFTCIGHLGAVESIAAGKNVFATGSWDKTIKIWSMETEGESLLKKGKKKQKLQEAVVKVEKGSLEGHGGTVSCMQFDPNENTLYTGSWDHSVRVWDVEQQTNVHTMNCEKIVACMDYIPESQSIVTGHEDGMIRIWDPRSKEGLVVKMKLGPHKNWTSSIRKSPNSLYNLATGSYDGTIKVWDVRSTTSLYTLTQESKIFGIDWSKDMIVSGGEDTKLHIYMQQ